MKLTTDSCRLPVAFHRGKHLLQAALHLLPLDVPTGIRALGCTLKKLPHLQASDWKGENLRMEIFQEPKQD